MMLHSQIPALLYHYYMTLDCQVNHKLHLLTTPVDHISADLHTLKYALNIDLHDMCVKLASVLCTSIWPRQLTCILC